METPRLLFVHAHPDDETLTTGATIAHYRARGAQVQVLTCTLGEEGEVIGEQWALLAADRADQLGGYRIAELTAALAELGVDRPRFLGGAGRWRDSGMAGSPPRRGSRFSDGDLDEQAASLAAVVDDLRPHVVVTYDPNGGYGHPDHIRAHQVTMAGVAVARWRVPKVYWTVTARSAVTAALARLDGVPAGWTPIDAEVVPTITYADETIGAAVDATAALPAKVAALRAHATQVQVSEDGTVMALSNNIALPVWAEEHYVLVEGAAGERDARGWETDLLAGVSLG
jgi:N-acetyl-1-D-myo-inositol-2-amino-2-deoxy-alpha-D-glucopyranoside deacetylase